jgi:hypothetical protein
VPEGVKNAAESSTGSFDERDIRVGESHMLSFRQAGQRGKLQETGIYLRFLLLRYLPSSE